MNRKRFASVFLVMFFILGAVPTASATGTSFMPGIGMIDGTCPIMKNRKTKKKFYAEYLGERVYFCCGSCMKRFKKDPYRYLKLDPTLISHPQ